MAHAPEFRSILDPSRRKHVTTGFEWGHRAGTDFWLLMNSGFDQFAAAATTVGEQLAENGWTATSLVNTAGSGADFRGSTFTRVITTGPQAGNRGINGTFADAGTPNHALTNASADLLSSPRIFGDAAHMHMAAEMAGINKLPDLLVAKFWGSMSVFSADEPRTGWGFMEDDGTAGIEADQYAWIRTNSTNDLLCGNAATLTTGPASDSAWHQYKIVLQFTGTTGPNIYAYRDGTIFSATPGVGIQDEFPLYFGFHAFTTNRPLLGLTHIYYDWI